MFFFKYIVSRPRNHSWASCPDGYFLQGFYLSNDVWLHNIKQASCCRPNNYKKTSLHCNEQNVSVSMSSQGWSKCQDWSYLVGVYKGACDEVHCIEAFRCCRMPPPGIPALHCMHTCLFTPLTTNRQQYMFR